MKTYIKRFIFFLACLFTSLSATNMNYKPIKGYVPNEKTAITIAIAILGQIYGVDKIEKEKPFKAKLKNGIWHVVGSVKCPKGVVCVGGAATIDISKHSGCILKVIHGK